MKAKAASQGAASVVTGTIITMDPARPSAQAMAISNGRIVKIGTRADCKAAVDPQHTEFNYRGGAVIPGLIDSHNHMLATGLQQQLADLSRCRSVGDIQRALCEYAANHPHVPWIVCGQGWHVEHLRENRYPSRAELDQACPDRPVYLPRIYHAAAVNSRALQLAGVTRDTPDPPGGKVVRDADGEPTGLLLEAPAMRLVDRLVPAVTESQQRKALESIQRAYLEAGVCGVIEPGLQADEIRLYQELRSSGDLHVRTVAMPLAPDPGTSPDFDAWLSGWTGKTGTGDTRLKLGGIKVFLDGGASLGTALLRAPYPDNRCNCGIQVTSTESLMSIANACAAQGWSLGVHAVGGGAIDTALDVFRRVNDRTPIRDLRFSLIHAYLWPSQDNMRLAADMGVCVATQASMQHQFAPGLTRLFGRQPIARATPIRSWLDAGVVVAGGSDSPATPYQPFLGIWHAVTRYVDALQEALGLEQCISVYEALELYTRHAAWLSFSEHERGVLREGMCADWVALSDNPLTCDHRVIKTIKPLATAIDGQVLYAA